MHFKCVSFVSLLCITFQIYCVLAEYYTVNLSNCSSTFYEISLSMPNCTITCSEKLHIQCTGKHAIKVWIADNVETQIRCTHREYMRVNAIFQNGKPDSSLRDSYIHQERFAENMSDPSTFTYVVTLNPGNGRIIKYLIRDQDEVEENAISVMVLYSEWENITGWMTNNALETIFDANDEVILIPCIDSGPHVPARLCIVEELDDDETLVPIPQDNVKITYDPSNGFYVNTTTFTDYNKHLYRCMEEHETINDNGWDFRIVDLTDLKVTPLKPKGEDIFRLFASKILNVAPIEVRCNHKDPIRLEGRLTTDKLGDSSWLINFYTLGEILERGHSKETDISHLVQYETRLLPTVRYIANYRTGLEVFDELNITCISESSGEILYNWTFVVHDAESGNDVTGNKYLQLGFPTRKVIDEGGLSYEYQCYSQTYNDARLRSIRCSNPIQCALLEDCFDDSYRCSNVVTEGSPCPKSELNSFISCRKSRALLPGQLTLCENNLYRMYKVVHNAHPSLYQSIELAVDRERNNFYQRKIDSHAIIRIENPEYEYFYTKGSFTFKCKVHQFFSEGQIYWAILYNNGSQTDDNKFEEVSRQNATDLMPHSQSSKIMLESPDVDKIICFAPDIYSNKRWLRSTLQIQVQESIPPKILTEETESTFEENSVGQSIECQAGGFPLPTIEWSRFGEVIDDPLRVIDEPSTNTKILRFEIANKEIEGVYLCTASNIVENATKEFTVSIKKDTKFLVAVISVVMGLVVMLVPLLLLYRRYRLSKKPQIKLDETELDLFVNGLPEDQRNPEDPTQLPFKKEYEIAKDDIDYIDKKTRLGGGEFGDVYLGRLKGIDIPYAFKMTKPNCPANVFEALRIELKVMTFIGPHVNVIALRGAYVSEIKIGILYVVMELCENGDLETFIKRKHNYYGTSLPELPNGSHYEHLQAAQSFGFHDLLLWSEQIATGMEFLSKEKIVHLDLSARNVLLSSDRTAKISDFGLSRRLYERINYVKTGDEPLPWRWLAIECLLTNTFSTESDVWAYGILLWELFSLGDEPYPSVKWSTGFGNQLKMGLRNLKAEHSTDEIDQMMRLCWMEEPQQRPGFSELRSFFTRLRIPVYIHVQ